MADPAGIPPRRMRVFGQGLMRLVARYPSSWRLFRAPIRRFFDRVAPDWDTRTARPERMAPLEAALDGLGEPDAALDLGTGTGAAALWIARRFPRARVVGVDISPRMVELAGLAAETEPDEVAGRISFDVADASALPFADGEFDLVVQLSVPVFFDEVARVLAPGGHAVVADTLGTDTPFHTPAADLRRGFARRGLEPLRRGAAGRGLYFVVRKPSPAGGG